MSGMMKLSEAAKIMRGALRGPDRDFGGVGIDSRCIARDELFVAITGARRDGHDFLAQACEAGAAGALVSSVSPVKGYSPENFARIKVTDTTAALGRLGADWRARFNIPLVAITGSNGKTSVTALLASIFNAAGNCLAPRASYNNQWGVPLTLLRLRARHTHAVVEMGMNRRGEIAKLSELAKPGIALINNVAPAHLSGLKNLQGVAEAKSEIFTNLAHDGVAVLNADDRFYSYCAEHAARHRRLTFGLENAADVRATEVHANGRGSHFQLRIGDAAVHVQLHLLGAHNVRNALAAAAAAHAAGVALNEIRDGLQALRALPGRLRPLRAKSGALILDDAYNANPDSLKAALEVLSRTPGKRIAVLGAMAELGARTDALHHEVGECARNAGVAQLFCLAPPGRCGSKVTVTEDPVSAAGLAAYRAGFGKGAKCFVKVDTLLAQLTPLLGDDVSVLIKGSRAAAMERVVDALIPPNMNASQNTGGGAAC